MYLYKDIIQGSSIKHTIKLLIILLAGFTPGLADPLQILIISFAYIITVQ